MAIVLKSGHKPKPVKNLGWLLRHAWQVERITVSAAMPPELVLTPFPAHAECYMIAELSGGVRYLTKWASRQVCRAWLQRRSLKHASLNWEA